MFHLITLNSKVLTGVIGIDNEVYWEAKGLMKILNYDYLSYLFKELNVEEIYSLKDIATDYTLENCSLDWLSKKLVSHTDTIHILKKSNLESNVKLGNDFENDVNFISIIKTSFVAEIQSTIDEHNSINLKKWIKVYQHLLNIDDKVENLNIERENMLKKLPRKKLCVRGEITFLPMDDSSSSLEMDDIFSEASYHSPASGSTASSFTWSTESQDSLQSCYDQDSLESCYTRPLHFNNFLNFQEVSVPRSPSYSSCSLD